MNYLELLRDICLLRRGPQDVSATPRLMVGVFLLSIVIDTLHLWLYVSGWAAFFYSLVLLLNYSVLVWALLVFKGFKLRFPQTITAIWGVDVVIGFLAACISWLDILFHAQLALVLTFCWFILLIWALCINGHILRQALNINLWLAIPLAWALTMLNNLILNVLIRHGNV